jgi:magnesium-transporting ATPase (P-type)
VLQRAGCASTHNHTLADCWCCCLFNYSSICRLFIWILFIAAVVSAGLQAWADMGLILGVVVINVAIGLFQEGKAEKVRGRSTDLLPILPV